MAISTFNPYDANIYAMPAIINDFPSLVLICKTSDFYFTNIDYTPTNIANFWAFLKRFLNTLYTAFWYISIFLVIYDILCDNFLEFAVGSNNIYKSSFFDCDDSFVLMNY